MLDLSPRTAAAVVTGANRIAVVAVVVVGCPVGHFLLHVQGPVRDPKPAEPTQKEKDRERERITEKGTQEAEDGS